MLYIIILYLWCVRYQHVRRKHTRLIHGGKFYASRRWHLLAWRFLGVRYASTYVLHCPKNVPAVVSVASRFDRVMIIIKMRFALLHVQRMHKTIKRQQRCRLETISKRVGVSTVITCRERESLPVKNRFVHFQTTLFGIHFSLDKIGQLQHITYLDVSAHPGLSDSVVVF